MPLYEYKCSGCGKTFEVIQKFSDEPLKTHPECGGATERLLSPPALQFKGSGWYVTDYAKSNGSSKSEGGSDAKDAKSGAGDKKAGDKKSGSESASSESKPAASSDSKSSSSSSSTSNPK